MAARDENTNNLWCLQDIEYYTNEIIYNFPLQFYISRVELFD